MSYRKKGVIVIGYWVANYYWYWALLPWIVTDANNSNKFCNLNCTHIFGTGLSKKGFIGYWAFKKGGHWVPDGSIGIGTKQKRGSLGIGAITKREYIDRHMTRTHILECPSPCSKLFPPIQDQDLTFILTLDRILSTCFIRIILLSLIYIY